MAVTFAKREAYWNHWCNYVQPLFIDPYLQHESFTNKVRAETGFGGRVQIGFYGRGHRVTVSRVQTALSAVGQTYKLDLRHNPLYWAHERYLKAIELMCEGFRRNDPIPFPKISTIFSPKTLSRVIPTSDLFVIAFYYLLRVGDYTTNRTRWE